MDIWLDVFKVKKVSEASYTQKYYMTSLKGNAFDYLEKFLFFHKITSLDQSYWKWAIISLHGAIYHLMLLNLQHTDCSGVWEKEKRNKGGLIDLSEEEKMRLYNFLEAFKKIKRNYSNFNIQSDVLENNIKELNRLRNIFIHYKSTSWSIEIKKFEEIISEVYPLLDLLINNDNMFWEQNERGKIKNILRSAKR